MTENKIAIDFVRYILENLCEEKDGIEISEIQDEMGTLITIQVQESDMGRAIGKNGKTVDSLRTLLRVIGARTQERINLKVINSSDQI